MIGNPLFEQYEAWRSGRSAVGPESWQRAYGFTVPDEDALALIAHHSPHGLVEIGAGTGYWARLLADRGVDVVAYDIEPPPSRRNQWFADVTPWYPVQRGDEQALVSHPDRTLLIGWPTRNEEWPAKAARIHLEGGGQRLVYVGEGAGGRTGDIYLHAVLGLLDRCFACAYGVTSAPCTCEVEQRWHLLAARPLPRWADRDDQVMVFAPASGDQERRGRRRWPFGRRRR